MLLEFCENVATMLPLCATFQERGEGRKPWPAILLRTMSPPEASCGTAEWVGGPDWR